MWIIQAGGMVLRGHTCSGDAVILSWREHEENNALAEALDVIGRI